MSLTSQEIGRVGRVGRGSAPGCLGLVTDILARMSQGCYEENGPVEFKLNACSTHVDGFHSAPAHETYTWNWRPSFTTFSSPPPPPSSTKTIFIKIKNQSNVSRKRWTFWRLSACKLQPHCKEYPYIHGYFVASFPYFNEPVPYMFVTVNRRNHEARGPTLQFYRYKRIRNRLR